MIIIQEVDLLTEDLMYCLSKEKHLIKPKKTTVYYVLKLEDFSSSLCDETAEFITFSLPEPRSLVLFAIIM